MNHLTLNKLWKQCHIYRENLQIIVVVDRKETVYVYIAIDVVLGTVLDPGY